MSTRLGYVVTAEAYYAEALGPRSPELTVGRYADNGGCIWEFKVETVVLRGRPVPRVCMFDDAWQAFADVQARPLFKALADLGDGASLADVREVLARVGFTDVTLRKDPHE